VGNIARSSIPFKLPSLPTWIIETFQDKPEQSTLDPRRVLYRYGSDPQQLIQPGKGDWFFMSEDHFDMTEDAVEFLCLLDHTAAGTYGVDKATGQKVLIKALDARGTWSGADSALPWNTGRWRAKFSIRQEISVWLGTAGSMAFDLARGKRYRGPGDMVPHLTRSGGASQVMVHTSLYSLLNLEGCPSALSRTLH
jgi:hypothetical protein